MMISTIEFGRRAGIDSSTVRRRIERGIYKTAKKAPEDGKWLIDDSELPEIESGTDMVEVDGADFTPVYRQALTLHQTIMANIELAATSVLQMCKSLKEMRDTKLYEKLGFDDFEDYTEQAVGLKRRQAYNYIAAYERLPSSVLQSNAHLGITKLVLLSQVPDLERAEFVENNDLEGMSTREIREMVDKMRDQGEQLSLLQEENERLQAAKAELDAISEKEDDLSKAIDEANAKIAALEQRNKELESRPVDVAVQEPDAEMIAKFRAEADATAEQKIKDAERAAKEATEKKIEKAKKDAAREAEERMRNSLAVIEEEKARALERAAEMEQQLKVSGDTDTALFAHHFDELQASYGKIMEIIDRQSAVDAEKADKLRGALVQALEQLGERAAEV